MSYINREEAIKQIQEIQSLYVGQLFDLVGRTIDVIEKIPDALLVNEEPPKACVIPVDIIKVKHDLDEIVEKYEIEAEVSRYAKKYVDALMVAKAAIRVVEKYNLLGDINDTISAEIDDELIRLILDDEIKRKMEELKDE